MNPLMKNPAGKFKALPEAAKKLPGPVFQQWLKLRRQGADLFFPPWRTTKNKEGKIRALDVGARLMAQMN
jgi:hypothetical protein